MYTLYKKPELQFFSQQNSTMWRGVIVVYRYIIGMPIVILFPVLYNVRAVVVRNSHFYFYFVLYLT